LFPLLSPICCALIYASAFGAEFDLSAAILVLFGVLFLVIGNYLPKCRQNYSLGIKLPWTVNNEENWNATHRFGGRVWVIGGIIFLACIVLPDTALPYALIGLILVMVVVPTVYSYVYYRKQLAAGTATTQDGRFITGPYSRRTSWIVGSIGVLILAAALLLMVTGDIRMEYGTQSFTIKASYHEDLTIEYERIEQLEFRTKDDPGERIYGFGSPRLGMGTFQNDEFGYYTRYTYASCDACVVLTVDGQTLVVNGADTAATEAIYQELLARGADTFPKA